MGVGSLAAAAAVHYRAGEGERNPLLVGVEPASAACVLASARAGEITLVPGPHTSLMDCLHAGVPSRTAFPIVLAGFDAFTAVGDEDVPAAVAEFARHGVVAGLTGAAGLVGVLAIRDELGLPAEAEVLLINSEGFADPRGYADALQSASRSPAVSDDVAHQSPHGRQLRTHDRGR
jgi:diaminopropionate ammonia-lyase